MLESGVINIYMSLSIERVSGLGRPLGSGNKLPQTAGTPHKSIVYCGSGVKFEVIMSDLFDLLQSPILSFFFCCCNPFQEVVPKEAPVRSDRSDVT